MINTTTTTTTTGAQLCACGALAVFIDDDYAAYCGACWDDRPMKGGD